MKENTKNKVLPLFLSAVVVFLDQWTKFLVVKHIPKLSIWTDDGVIEVLGKYSAAEIAKVLEKHGYISKIVRQGSSTAKVRTLPYRCCINHYIADSSDK